MIKYSKYITKIYGEIDDATDPDNIKIQTTALDNFNNDCSNMIEQGYNIVEVNFGEVVINTITPSKNSIKQITCIWGTKKTQ